MQWFIEQFPSTRTVMLAKGDVLFQAGESVKLAYWLERGGIALRRLLSQGEFLTVSHIVPGNLIAEASLFSSHYHCAGVADQDCVVRVYAMDEIRQRLEQDPFVARQLGYSLAKEIMQLRTRLELSGIHSAHERLLSWIKLNADETGMLCLNRSLKSIASELGMAHETLYRSLNKLEKNGLIVRTTDSITML